MTIEQLGRRIADAVRNNDRTALEAAAQAAGTYRVLVTAADAAGVDRDTLEEMLASI